jgi:hypothetical protein
MQIQPLRVIQRIVHEGPRGQREEADRKLWPAGEWDNEPDLVEWRDAATGYPCLIVRNGFGGLCGYVGVPEAHPAHGKDYQGIDFPHGGDPHGGLTFASPCGGDICHVPLPGEADSVWWLGFDCAHSGDLCPGLMVIGGRVVDWRPEYEQYRAMGYVERECTALAAGLKAMEAPP